MSIRDFILGSTAIVNFSVTRSQLNDWMSTVVFPGAKLMFSVALIFSLICVAAEMALIIEEIKLRGGRPRRGNERRWA